MIDVVAFLIENFPDIHECPKGQDLGYMLENAGFDDEDIGEAIMCVELLNESPILESQNLNSSQALRVYHDGEADALSAEIRGLLHFLHESGALNASQREFVIHALMHLPYDEMTLDKAKVLALLVLWAHRSELPVLIGDELMAVLHGKGVMQ
ncbi:DUF494 family protein [Wielerella bovis]|uniref:DUF494 family protein n=1 Tax=Wielerella bovis TaxID=2917790 RepID=UPI002018D5DC|nr:DUF494 domain-containing protein [Wielerella bovis]MCG7657986.1 DUF494 domain-containing protein [Wielerella bovis]MCG7660208.1 DUF494 domain-containing protein [Wielerella bovis]ULJ65897.1 DUF494 domain-containing protein [Wielerella bovis]ULJ68292.1 DUF494 domain-containing protein [Wielerella bovis]